MTKNQYSQYRPHIHNLDSYTLGWQVFPAEPDTVKEYDNIHVKWTLGPEKINNYGHRNRDTMLHMSIDGGKTWKQADGWYGLYLLHFRPNTGWNRANFTADIPSILEAKAKVIRERAKASAKRRREVFKKLSPEQQEVTIANKAAIKAKRAERLQNEKEQATSGAISQLLELGPVLVKLRDEIDDVIKAMGNGGINKEFPYYPRTRREFMSTSYYIQRMQLHIKRCQGKGKGVK